MKFYVIIIYNLFWGERGLIPKARCEWRRCVTLCVTLTYIQCWDAAAAAVALVTFLSSSLMTRGAGSKLKVGGHEFRREAPEKNFFCAPLLFCRAHPVWGGTAHTRVGTKMGSHSPLFVPSASVYSDFMALYKCCYYYYYL